MSTLLHLPYVLLDLFTFFPSTEIDGATYPTAGRHAFVTVALQQLVDQRKEIRKRLPAPLAGRHPNKAETSHDSGPGETLHDARSCDLKTVKNLHEETECVYIYISELLVEYSLYKFSCCPKSATHTHKGIQRPSVC